MNSIYLEEPKIVKKVKRDMMVRTFVTDIEKPTHLNNIKTLQMLLIFLFGKPFSIPSPSWLCIQVQKTNRTQHIQTCAYACQYKSNKISSHRTIKNINNSFSQIDNLSIKSPLRTRRLINIFIRICLGLFQLLGPRIPIRLIRIFIRLPRTLIRIIKFIKVILSIKHNYNKICIPNSIAIKNWALSLCLMENHKSILLLLIAKWSEQPLDYNLLKYP